MNTYLKMAGAELRKLGELLDAGMLTESELAGQKARPLGR
jgi:hypothetical protein